MVMSRGTVGVVGSSNSAWALSCYLSRSGFEVHMLVRNRERVQGLTARNEICATGKIEGTFPVKEITGDERSFLSSVRTLFLTTTATAYIDVMKRLLPHLSRDHEILLFSSKLGGCLEVSKFLQDHERSGVKVLETDALFACRITDERTIWVRGFKGWNLYSSETASKTAENAPIISRYFTSLEPARNFLQRGLTDFGAMTHPLIMLINMNAVDRKQKFLFYYEGFTPRTFRLLEALEEERARLAEAYETSFISLAVLLDRYYGCLQGSLYSTLLNVPNYRHSVSPDTIDHRYLYEDVSCTLVPWHYLARLAGVKTPLLDSLITMASILLDTDFLQRGRTLERLGLEGMTCREITRWMNS